MSYIYKKTHSLSIKKNTQELDCNVIFSLKNITFHDRTSGEMIGEGKLENGLYILKSQGNFYGYQKN
jgi:hypothetical protein